jgi:NTE family protein
MSDVSHLSEQERLKRIPFFSSLPAPMFSELVTRSRYEHYRQGEVIFVEGSLGDSLYFIESGQVKISVRTAAGERILNYLGPGNFFGEMAILLNQRRSATVTVVIDADLRVLRKSDLDALLEKYPVAALQITRELSRRLTDTIQKPVKEDIYNLVTVVGDEPWRLAAGLARLTGERVVLLDLAGANLAENQRYLPGEIAVESISDSLTGQEVVEKVSVLADTYDRVLVSIKPEACESGAKAVQLAKVTILIEMPPCPWIEELFPTPVWHIVDSPQEVERAVRRLARRLVGLALSSGGARGIAHVGVLRVLEREGIPIDMIAGTSAGALFGGLYAAGCSIEAIDELARDFHKALSVRNLLDIALVPRTGLIRGRRFRTYLEKLFGGISFEELGIPFYAVAADVMTGEEVDFDKGSVADAVRASTSIVGLLMPHQIGDRYLIDGGAVNPLPVSVLAARGAHIIVASRAIPTMEDEIEHRRASRSGASMSIPAVLTNFQSIMEREIIKNRLSEVDVIIAPRVETYTAMDYRQAAAFIRLGEEAAERAIPDIKRKLSPGIQ